MADSLPDDSKTASFIGITVAICGNVLISLALNCQKLAHRRLDERRQLQLFYGSSSHTSSSTATPIDLSRTNSNARLNGNGNSGAHDPHGEERRPLLGANRGNSMPVTHHEYRTSKENLQQMTKNKVLLGLAKLRPRSTSKPPAQGPIPEEVLSPVIEHYPSETPDEPGTTEEDHLVDDDELDETPRAESDYLRSKLWCVHLYIAELLTRLFTRQGGSVSFL
jgi:magnesium transporter